jgi:alpha-1,3-rhamnosyl/mannosyltransferase
VNKRVGLNLMWLVPGVVGGSEEYTTRLLLAVADEPPPGVDLILFVNQRLRAAYPELVERFRTIEAPVTGGHKGVRVLAENTWLLAQARRRRLDLLHHLGGIMPFVRSCPSMLTVHDLQPLVMPEHFAARKRWFARLSIPPSARGARVIVTLTQVTRDMLVERLGVAPGRIEVIPAGIRLPTDVEVAAERAVDVRTRYGMGDTPFFLYPAITYPHKNHLFLVEAFAGVARHDPDVVLVLTGGSAQMEEPLLAALGRLHLRDRVLRLGRIPRSDLDSLYHEATALVFPSRFEGFGIPVLEAMSRGCPVLAADATALPEVGGDAALLLPLADARTWTSAMLAVLDDPVERSRLAAAGRERAAEFDWSRVAGRLAGVYDRVLSEL